MNLYAACKCLAKHEIPAMFINKMTFRIGDKELTVKDGMVYTDTARWRFNTFRDFFYSLKSEHLIYLTREQMNNVCSYYFILTERPKEQKREVERSFRLLTK